MTDGFDVDTKEALCGLGLERGDFFVKTSFIFVANKTI